MGFLGFVPYGILQYLGSDAVVGAEVLAGHAVAVAAHVPAASACGCRFLLWHYGSAADFAVLQHPAALDQVLQERLVAVIAGRLAVGYPTIALQGFCDGLLIGRSPDRAALKILPPSIRSAASPARNISASAGRH
jgi:hypothetical protein